MNLKQSKSKWLTGVALAGLAWNVYGVFQFLMSLRSTPESLMKMGMNEAQAQLMTSYPMWMTAAFALGTFGGTLGCVLLLTSPRKATPVFALSLAAYIVLFVGDITEGVFAALGISQVMILSVVILIALALFIFSLRTNKSFLFPTNH